MLVTAAELTNTLPTSTRTLHSLRGLTTGHFCAKETSPLGVLAPALHAGPPHTPSGANARSTSGTNADRKHRASVGPTPARGSGPRPPGCCFTSCFNSAVPCPCPPTPLRQALDSPVVIDNWSPIQAHRCPLATEAWRPGRLGASAEQTSCTPSPRAHMSPSLALLLVPLPFSRLQDLATENGVSGPWPSLTTS